MKVHNYGNDYAFYMKQKQEENKATFQPETAKEPSTENKEVNDVINQVQTEGEKTVANPERAEQKNFPVFNKKKNKQEEDQTL